MSVKTVLIANRGEIASRIIRTCRQKGYRTVAVYSDADAAMPYVQQADESVNIGPPPVAQSYLQADRIIEAALKQKADFIHPGYGLLSENADFAAKTTAAGITFIGPEADVIRSMGDKLTARSTMEKAGIPVIPGGEKIGDIHQALSQAEDIGYPVMLKASAGGGGIGLQMCSNEDELRKAYDSARSKAKAYFGDDTLFLETYMKQPRHIEVQIAADQYGQFVHLFERDCSIQRRHQKVIEESPSPFLDERMCTDVCRAAVQAASAVHYTGVGTVEFIVGEDKRFFFLEMNTRLQVEHPVTEEVTGVDLVALQLDIAEGQPLPFQQEQVQRLGHALEMRVYAEDPQTFMPAPGTITAYERVSEPGVRFEDSIEAGVQITPFYDPLIAKIITNGRTRQESLGRAVQVLEQLKLEGIKHNVPFLRDVLRHPHFQAGTYTTHFVREQWKRNEKD